MIKMWSQIFYFLVILIISGDFVHSAVRPKQDETTPVSLDDILSNALGAGGFGGSWVRGSNESILRVISGLNVWELNVLTGDNRTILEPTAFGSRFNGSTNLGLSFSGDNNYILVEHDRQALWRYSYLAKYDVYSLDSRSFTKLEPRGLEGGDQERLQLVRFASQGHDLVFIYENNVYHKSDHEASSNTSAQQLTTDGGHDIFNGISDWVYEEEMFGSPVAFWFSTDNTHLAYVRFDDSKVQNFSWPEYGEPGTIESQYPVYEPIRYPKAGRDNPEISLHVVNLNNQSRVEINIGAPSGSGNESIVARVDWATPATLLVQILNRHQNTSVWNYCNAQDGSCDLLYRYDQANGWIDAHAPTISRDGSKFLTILPVRQNIGDLSYDHILQIRTNATNGQNATVLTAGQIHIDSILAWDENNGIIYFSATGLHRNTSLIADPSERQVYAASDTISNGTPNCFSCSIRNIGDEECASHSVSFSSNFAFYQHTCRGPGVPAVSTRATSSNSVVRMWNDNAATRARLALKRVPIVRDLEVGIEGGYTAKVRLFLPPNFNANNKYPLLIDVYAGPSSQRITDDYGYNWGTYMVSSNNIIYGSIDGRGSGRQSAEQRFEVYRNLGTAEIIDQIEVTKNLTATLSYIDADRVAIWGWSYGGYATAMALGIDTDSVFKCGISVAPVTSWLYYDTIYTERYMGLPSAEDNWEGYNESSVMNHIDNFRNKSFLLIHGNADDNVHYQQSMMLARALERRDIMFDSLPYPDENHSINGAGMRRHLYHSIERFLNRECNFDGIVDTSGARKSGLNIFLPLAMLTVIISAFKAFH